jgi:hypothetical protein
MKVLDLQCVQGHVFEGWFSNEADFVHQCQASMVQCPVCGTCEVHKKLSAPRLNLGATPHVTASDTPVNAALPSAEISAKYTAAWLEAAKHIVAHTTDVGTDFAEEARKIHYGDAPERAIRGQSTVEETKALLEEGIEVLPIALPAFLKEPLQ